MRGAAGVTVALAQHNVFNSVGAPQVFMNVVNFHKPQTSRQTSGRSRSTSTSGCTPSLRPIPDLLQELIGLSPAHARAVHVLLDQILNDVRRDDASPN